MRKILISALMEFKNLRLFKLQIIISLGIIPFSYLFVVLLYANGSDIPYLLSGFSVISLFSSLITLLSLRISNLMEPEVVELYSTLPVNYSDIIISYTLVYVILALPQSFLSLGLSALNVNSVNLWLVGTGVVLGIILFGLMAISLGLFINNPYKAQGVVPLIGWLMLLLSPAYYHIKNYYMLAVLMVNPVTHVLNIIRAGLGDGGLRYVHPHIFYLIVLSILLSVYIGRRFKNVYMLEKLY
jgi:ABC-2 type transport system permease protein